MKIDLEDLPVHQNTADSRYARLSCVLGSEGMPVLCQQACATSELTSLQLLPGGMPVSSDGVCQTSQEMQPVKRSVLLSHSITSCQCVVCTQDLQLLPEIRPVVFAWFICIAQPKEAVLKGLADVSAWLASCQNVSRGLQDCERFFLTRM